MEIDYMRLARAGDATGDAGQPMNFIAATPGKKRDGYDTATLPWRVDSFRSAPIVTWVHDFGGDRLPIGRADVKVEDTSKGEELRAAITFDQGDPFAREVERKYRDGFLFAVSVSWDDVDEDGIPVRNSGKKAVAHDLLEIAAVPVPGDPSALKERQVTALRALREDLDAVLDSGGPDANAGAPVVADGSRAVAGSYEALADRVADAIRATGLFPGYIYVLATFDDFVVIGVYNDDGPSRLYRVAYTAADGAITIGDWLPVRLVQDIEGLDGSAVRLAVDGDDPWVSAATAMVDVFTRGSGDPDDRRKRTYRALQGHYRRAKRVMPEWVERAELDALDDDNWRALFVAGEVDVVAACHADGARVGAELSARNLTEFSEALDAITDGAKRIGAVLDRVRDGKATVQPDGEEATEPGAGTEWIDQLHAALTRQES